MESLRLFGMLLNAEIKRQFPSDISRSVFDKKAQPKIFTKFSVWNV